MSEIATSSSACQTDGEIAECLVGATPRSFFLFAGAGSGKTRSLIEALRLIEQRLGPKMRLTGQQVAVITYTNAARDEIIHRLDANPLVAVSTIHSFVWELIRGFNGDIRPWIAEKLQKDIAELQEKQQRGRGGNASEVRRRAILSKQQRLATLPDIRTFTYNPNGENEDRDSLSHGEVIGIGAYFLTTKPLAQRLVVSQYPVLLVDESQDTNGLLMNALLGVQDRHKGQFSLGLFGDTMQSIYADGKPDLARSIPRDWATPAKLINHRSPIRVIELINRIRSEVDTHSQRPRADAPQGHVRMFICRGGDGNKAEIEQRARNRMAATTGDATWSDMSQVKMLILEHHMAARRMGFLPMFEPLYAVDSYKTGFRNGELPALRFFAEQVLPLVNACQATNIVAATSVLRQHSPLLDRVALERARDPGEHLRRACGALDALVSLFAPGNSPSFLAVLQQIASTELLYVPGMLGPFATPSAGSSEPTTEVSSETATKLLALRTFLDTPFAQIRPYKKYVEGEAPFDTHQGVKGREFPRVMVIMDDDEAGGFMFSYEKLFGAKERTAGDLKHEAIGAETGIDRTRRLFYVTCSRSQQALALVAYTEQPTAVQQHVIRNGWVRAEEIEFLS
jgi:DNA helicase-2/ATP-dependent DNA helicase PcrA